LAFWLNRKGHPDHHCFVSAKTILGFGLALETEHKCKEITNEKKDGLRRQPRNAAEKLIKFHRNTTGLKGF
jgi:hypothetical protein